jgi:hypothetical protein
VGLNPLHALFTQERERASPYHPSDRRFLDPIYVDVAAGPAFVASAAAREALATREKAIAALAAGRLVDYRRVWDMKRAVLDACFAQFERRPAGDPLVVEFERFAAAGGQSLQNFAIFEAIAEQFPGQSSRRWPDEFQWADSPHVTTFAVTRWSRVRYALYLQWLADRQLAEAARTAVESGLSLSFYRDLAVAQPDGAGLGQRRRLRRRAASRSAPPDHFSEGGYGTCRADPRAARREQLCRVPRHRPANVRRGALRIDHAAALACSECPTAAPPAGRTWATAGRADRSACRKPPRGASWWARISAPYQVPDWLAAADVLSRICGSVTAQARRASRRVCRSPVGGTALTSASGARSAYSMPLRSSARVPSAPAIETRWRRQWSKAAACPRRRSTRRRRTMRRSPRRSIATPRARRRC